MKKTIIFDIDGTLANLDHRLHFVNGPHKDWGQFLARVKDDAPIEQTIFLNQLLHNEAGWVDEMYDIVLCSGRSDNERADTVAWLEKYGVRYDALYMRKAGDYRADYVIKKEILDQMRAEGREPWLVFDDRQSVVDMWRKEGLFVLQCAPKETFLDVYNFHEKVAEAGPLVIMVGPSGAGKSSFLTATNTHAMGGVISSDTLRQQICGDFRDQSQNERVFEAMMDIAATRLKHGLPVVLDATHIKTADRKKAVGLVPPEFRVNYWVIDRPLKDKLETAGWRAEVNVKGKSLVAYHDQVMQSNLKDILKGDGFPNVKVIDLRSE